MNKTRKEDWTFELEVIEGEAKNCRVGLEKGDKLCFEYGCPEGICPRAMTELFPITELVRCGADFTHRGSKEKYEMILPCPDFALKFKLTAKKK